VDLRSYGALLDQARKSAAAQHQAPPDPGFNPTLPFKPGDQPVVDAAPPKAELGSPAAENTLDKTRSLGFLAGGLLATVLLMHAVWVRSEIKRADELEALAVDGPSGEPDAPQAPSNGHARHDTSDGDTDGSGDGALAELAPASTELAAGTTDGMDGGDADRPSGRRWRGGLGRRLGWARHAGGHEDAGGASGDGPSDNGAPAVVRRFQRERRRS
jgi:hypothetical protein